MLVIHTPNIRDTNLKALVDSKATQNFFCDSYVREKLLFTQSFTNHLPILLADSIMSMARYDDNIEFNIGPLELTQELIVTRFSGQHQIILSYYFLKDVYPYIDWTAGTLQFSDMETVQAIITKQNADVKHLSHKQISWLLLKKKSNERKKENKFKPRAGWLT